MAQYQPAETDDGAVPVGLRRFVKRRALELGGLGLLAACALAAAAIATWSPGDPSLSHAVDRAPLNLLGYPGAVMADELLQVLGLGSIVLIGVLMAWAVTFLGHDGLERPLKQAAAAAAGIVCGAAALSALPAPQSWALGSGLGGTVGDVASGLALTVLRPFLRGGPAAALVSVVFGALAFYLFLAGANIARRQVTHLLALGAGTAKGQLASGFDRLEAMVAARRQRARRAPKGRAKRAEPTVYRRIMALLAPAGRPAKPAGRPRSEPRLSGPGVSTEPRLSLPGDEAETSEEETDYADPAEAEADAGLDDADMPEAEEDEAEPPAPVLPVARVTRERKDIKPTREKTAGRVADFEMPPLTLLAEAKRASRGADISDEQLEANARALEGVLDDFGVKGQIINVRPGPVVTLYELEPAPGIKSSRVIGLADDIARSMSAISARVAVVPGRNAIGIELPNHKRETVYLRELLGSEAFAKTNQTLSMALGKNIGGEPVFADLARMPHLLIAGTTGSGKSVGINTMILSLLYRLPPERCKLIMIDPKMLELSVYEGIPHLLAPVVTDPRKAVVALKWAVREMEDRYRKMSKIGVRNIDGYNARVKEANAKGEGLSRTVQTGFDPDTGEPMFETEEMDGEPMPYIVVIIDEMADLMMVAGKDIEGAVQRLAQMARAAGIHVIMATQRPSVDVITGTIKANFPTRISFQVTSKIDSRTILGEQGAEQLLGQGDMLYMAGGGRIGRLHGPFVKDEEVEKIVKHLKAQGSPDYIEAVTDEDEDAAFGEPGASAGLDGESGGGSGDDLYDQAVAVVLRDKKVSTSYVQRRLQVGYNKAASLIERMEKEGLISSANATGKREILVPGDSARD